MANFLQFSNDLLAHAKETSDDYYAKAETLNSFLQTKALAAQGDAIAQYKLAENYYPKNSDPYFYWMRKSAKQGFTNAMLSLSSALVERGKIADLQQAAKYVIKIVDSDDRFINDELEPLLARNHLLRAEVARQTSNEVSKSSASFFACDVAKQNEQPVLQEDSELSAPITPQSNG